MVITAGFIALIVGIVLYKPGKQEQVCPQLLMLFGVLAMAAGTL